MNHYLHMLRVSGFILFGFWVIGCGGETTTNKGIATPSAEVRKKQEDLQRLQAFADTLTAQRLKLFREYALFQESSKLTPEQIQALQQQRAASGEVTRTEGQGGIFQKIGGGIKKLWPF